MDFADSKIRELTGNLRGKIDLVVRRTDAGGNLCHEIRWFDSGGGAEGLRGDRGDPELGAFFSGVDESDAPRVAVSEEYRRTIGNIDPEAYAWNGCQKTVSALDGKNGTGGDLCHNIAMDLLRCGKRHAVHTGLNACPLLKGFQPLKRLVPLDANIQAGNPADEGGPDPGDRVKCGKRF